MFTGIIRGTGHITHLSQLPGMIKFAVTTHDTDCLSNLEKGASVAIDGVCLTVVNFDSTSIWFDAIAETLEQTSLKSLHEGQPVNIERAARFGDEIGGHILSGHIYGTAKVDAVEKSQNNCILTLQCPQEWMKYIFPKGYIALNGASLTIVDANDKSSTFTVHLIPETLQNTTFSTVKKGQLINVEIDSQTQIIVDTLQRLQKRL